MYTYLVISNLVLSLSGTQAANFNELYNHLSIEEQQIMVENNIDSYEELDSYLNSDAGRIRKSKNGENGSGSTSDSILASGLKTKLDNDYPNYSWSMLDGNTTSSVSNAIPINMQGTAFPQADIQTALAQTGVVSDYGGCGPIAMMGIMDYFSRYLGYTELIADPTSSSDRVKLASDVLNEVSTFEFGFGGDKSTMTFPWDYKEGFNNLMKKYNISDVISADQKWKLFSGKKEEYWNTIVENVDKGLPVTLMTGLNSGSGHFASHYTNIYGYEKWVGYDSLKGEFKEIYFIKGRLNWSDYDNEYYCNADILDDSMIGLMTYNINYSNSYTIQAADFADEFVNSAGGGQYFFYNIAETVNTRDGREIYTNRLRCSYIENKYLVLSPNRSGAGTAYLDISLSHSASKITFDASMWGGQEYSSLENFKIQYYRNGTWNNHVSYDLGKFSTLKDYPDTYTLLLPKDVTNFRFYATHSNPSGSSNKGRIVLENIEFEYNL